MQQANSGTYRMYRRAELEIWKRHGAQQGNSESYQNAAQSIARHLKLVHGAKTNVLENSEAHMNAAQGRARKC